MGVVNVTKMHSIEFNKEEIWYHLSEGKTAQSIDNYSFTCKMYPPILLP